MDEVQLTTGEDEHLNHILEWYNRRWPNTFAMQGEIKRYIKKKMNVYIENALVYNKD